MPASPSPDQPDKPLPPGASTLISPAIRKRLQRCFDRAKEVLKQEKPDYDYAHTMFTECVMNDLGNLEYVEAMLENLQRKYGNNKRGALLKGFVSRGPFKKALADEDWEDVFRLGFDLLKTNPWDVPTLRALAQACQANHHNEVELRYLKNALDVNRKDIEVNKHCAESLERMGQFDQAIACWHRIEELDKDHPEARKKISELTIAKARGLGGVDTSASQRAGRTSTPPSRPVTKERSAGPSSAPAPPVAAPPAPSTSPSHEETDGNASPTTGSIADWQAALKKDPTDLDAYLALAEALTRENRFRDAYQTLKKGMEAAGGNHPLFLEKLEDAQIRMIRAQVAIAEKRAAGEASEEAADLAKRFRAELNRQELQILAARCERFPDDLTIRFELGLRLKREAKFHEAAKAFQLARQHPPLATVATLELGESLQHLRQYGLALQTYEAALQDGDPDSEAYRLALYRAGILAAALKNFEQAEEFFETLRSLDGNYRDVVARLDKLRQIRDKE